MGAGNVSLAYICWAKLPDRAFRLLAYMALVSMDTDNPPKFWGGHSALARALGRNTPDALPINATEAESKAWRADMEAVRAAVKALFQNGAISLDQESAPGQNARYALHLALGTRSNTPGSAWQTPQEFPGNTPGSACATPQDRPVDLGGVGGVTFDEKEEEGELGTSGGNKSPYVTTSPANSAQEIDDAYFAAKQILDRLPDFGQEFMKRLPGGLAVKTRAILAAEMARAERNAS